MPNDTHNRAKPNIRNIKEVSGQIKGGITTRFNRFFTFVQNLSKTVIAIITLTAVILILIFSFKEVMEHPVLIEPFNVSKNLEGTYNGEALANQLIDEMNFIEDQIKEGKYEKIRYSKIGPSTSDKEIIIPGAGISLKGILRSIARLFGYGPIVINGDAMLDNRNLQITVRVDEKSPGTFEGEFEESEPMKETIQKLLLSSAEHSLKYVQPSLLALYFFDIENYDRCIEVTEYMLANEPDDDDYLAQSLQADALKEKGDIEVAIQEYNRAIELAPEESYAYGRLAAVYLERGETEQAITKYEEALAVDSSDITAGLGLSKALEEGGKYEEAKKVEEEVITSAEEEDKDASYWNTRGLILETAGKYTEALEAYNKAIELEEAGNAVTFYNKGIVLELLGKYTEALEAYNKAIELDDKDSDFYNNKGNLLRKLGIYAGAIEAYDKAIKVSPSHAGIWYNRALAFKIMGDKTNALKDLEEAVRLEESLKEKLIKDKQFEIYWQDKDFLEITGQYENSSGE